MIAAILIAGVLVLFAERKQLFPGYGTEVRVATVVLRELGFAPTPLDQGLRRTLEAMGLIDEDPPR